MFDIEANDWIKFEMVGFYDGEEFIIFHTMKDFLMHVLNKKYRGYRIYAHNGGRYDFRFVIDEIENDRELNSKFELRFLFTADRIRELVLKDTSKHRWYLADSFALLPESLKKLTHDFDVQHKKKDDVDYTDIRKTRQRDRDYLKHDCIGLYEVLEKYFGQKIFQGIKIKGTIASNAMQIFRTTMTAPIKRTSPRMEEFIRRTYFGGRVECFRLYGQQVKHYDFNSLYPAVMIENEMPVGFPVWVDTFERGVPGFYHAEADVPSCVNIPALPVLKDNKLLFPAGSFEGFFTSCEMEAAERHGAKFKIKRGIIFNVTRPLFDDYIKMLYDMKKAADKESAIYFISKIFLNGLYGKFGQKPEKETIIKTTYKDAVKRELVPYLPELSLYKESRVSFAGYLLPHIASWITAKARLKLYDTLNEVKDPLYCDTDSVFTNKTLASDPTRLGALKFEGEYDKAVFLLPKLYALAAGKKYIVKAKGFGKKLSETISMDSFLKGLGGDLTDFRKEERRLVGIKTGWTRHGKTLVMDIDRKSVHSVYSKRLVMPDFSTKPLVLSGYKSEY